MNNIATIIKRELSSYFLSPIAYVIMAVFIGLYGIFFTDVFIRYSVANLQFTYGNLLIVLLFMIPLMTMRTLSEEKKQGTEELLMTSPLSTTEFIMGKYLSLLISLLILIGLLFIHLIIVLTLSKPDLGPIITSLFGLLMVGMAFIAVGMFTSSLSDNQIISGLLGFGFLLLFWLLDWVGGSIGGKLGDVLSSLSILKYFSDFNKGIIDTVNIIFYLSMTTVFLFLTVRQVESRRWR